MQTTITMISFSHIIISLKYCNHIVQTKLSNITYKTLLKEMWYFKQVFFLVPLIIWISSKTLAMESVTEMCSTKVGAFSVHRIIKHVFIKIHPWDISFFIMVCLKREAQTESSFHTHTAVSLHETLHHFNMMLPVCMMRCQCCCMIPILVL
jgi:hypothetical protein